AEALTTAALELTAYRVTSAEAEQRPSRGDFLFRLGRATVAVEFRSEAARIDLNMAPRELLAGLFVGLGAPPANAAYYADRIVGWRTPRDPDAADVEGPAYRTAGLTYGPPRAASPPARQLSLLPRLPPTLAAPAF